MKYKSSALSNHIKFIKHHHYASRKHSNIHYTYLLCSWELSYGFNWTASSRSLEFLKYEKAAKTSDFNREEILKCRWCFCETLPAEFSLSLIIHIPILAASPSGWWKSYQLNKWESFGCRLKVFQPIIAHHTELSRFNP